jgi:hypothetical protein
LGAGLAVSVADPAGALGFSAVHFPGGGLAGLPQEIRKMTANKLKPWLNNGFRSLII